jgi:hypothetical protein
MNVNTDVVNTRTGVGAAIGGAIGFVLGGPAGAGVGAVIGGGIAHASGPSSGGTMTARRKVIYTKAMETVQDPTELRKLADAFAGEGLRDEATMLRKRADLRSLPQDRREKRRVFFRKAMACDNPDAILEVALAFQKEGAFDAAKTLKEHADAVRAAHLAGRSASPMKGGSVSGFADKLGKALIHFGPDSAQAKMAARNLIQARGKQPTDALVAEVIRVASDALKLAAPEAASPAAPIQVDTTNGGVNAVAPDTGAVEPTVVGVPAGPVEEPVVAAGTTPVEAQIENAQLEAAVPPPPDGIVAGEPSALMAGEPSAPAADESAAPALGEGEGA